MYGILLSHLGWYPQLLHWHCYTSYKYGYAGLLVLLLAASLAAANHRNVTGLSLFYRYYFGRCSSEQGQLVQLPFFRGRSSRYSDRLFDFSVTFPRVCKDVYVNSFFPRTYRLWNSLPLECFHLTYNLSGFKSRITRHLFTVGSF